MKAPSPMVHPALLFTTRRLGTKQFKMPRQRERQFLSMNGTKAKSPKQQKRLTTHPQGLGQSKTLFRRVTQTLTLLKRGFTTSMNTPMAQEIGAALDEKYAFQLQSVLAGLDRQAAMMGTLGSPAHTNMINTAIAGSLENMAAEYANAIQASRDEELQLLGAIGDIEDGLAGSEEIRMVANSIFEQDVFAPAIATYSAYPPKQMAFFMGVTNDIKTKFQEEYSSAANQAQRDAIVDKYRTISSQFQSLLNKYAKRDALKYSETQANIDLQAIYAAAGFTGDDESQASYISFLTMG